MNDLNAWKRIVGLLVVASILHLLAPEHGNSDGLQRTRHKSRIRSHVMGCFSKCSLDQINIPSDSLESDEYLMRSDESMHVQPRCADSAVSHANPFYSSLFFGQSLCPNLLAKPPFAQIS